ncbi:hypothetical protein [Nocardioides nitrophenolicus]|uniref:hypothetical protein n=1 Tax=Nocardioides nitrophenolicus TaxID=60489 RepID=UPI00195EAB07|nr:hypothetical protein [Nocardioides nitrophenolicus]MBM7516125.1 hypothetical protein [Nocardioides nitrophenolicus]
MTITLEIPYAVLAATRGRWDAAADQLDGAWRRLARMSGDDLSAAVTAAVTAFAEPWVEEVRALARLAQEHADDADFFHRLLVLVDRVQADRLRALLPWAESAATERSRP